MKVFNKHAFYSLDELRIFREKKTVIPTTISASGSRISKKKTQWFEEDLIIIGMNLFAGLRIKISYFWLSVSK